MEELVHFEIVLKQIDAPSRKSSEYQDYVRRTTDAAKNLLKQYPQIEIYYSSSFRPRLSARSKHDDFEKLFHVTLEYVAGKPFPNSLRGYWNPLGEITIPRDLEQIVEMLYIPTPPTLC